MSNTEQLDPIKLIQQVKEMGLLDSKVTIKCVHCKIIFPKEYVKCPQCNTNGI